MPDLSDLNGILEQYGPIGLLAVAAVIIVRAYLAGQSGGILKIFVDGLLKQQPSRAETYALHAANTAGVYDPLVRFAETFIAVVRKTQAVTTGKPVAVAEPKKEGDE